MSLLHAMIASTFYQEGAAAIREMERQPEIKTPKGGRAMRDRPKFRHPRKKRKKNKGKKR